MLGGRAWLEGAQHSPVGRAGSPQRGGPAAPLEERLDQSARRAELVAEGGEGQELPLGWGWGRPCKQREGGGASQRKGKRERNRGVAPAQEEE